MRYWPVIAVLFVAACGSGSTTNPKVSEYQPVPHEFVDSNSPDNFWPKMTPELVMDHSADSLIQQWQPLNLGECGEDCFFECYASVLIPETNRRYPLALKLRPDVLSAFDAVREISCLMSGGGTGYGHEAARLHGRVEHILFTAFSNGFKTESDYALEPLDDNVEWALSRLIIQYDTAEFDDSSERLKEIADARQRFLNAIANFEMHLDTTGKRYFRNALTKYIYDWAGIQF